MILGFMPVKTITERDTKLIWSEICCMYTGRGLPTIPFIDELLVTHIIHTQASRELDKPARVTLEIGTISNSSASTPSRF